MGVEAEEVVAEALPFGLRAVSALQGPKGYDLDHLSVYEAIDAAGGKLKEADCRVFPST